MASVTTSGEARLTSASMQVAGAAPASEQGTHIAGRHARTGETVTRAPSAGDAIEDAKEELGMALAGRGKGDIEKMKVRHGQGTNFEALARIAEYYDKLPDLPSDERYRDLVLKFQKFEDLFRYGGDREGGAGLPTADDVRQLLAEFDGDVTHQFAVLEDMRMRASRAEAPPEYTAILDEVRSELRASDALRDVRAGFASAREAAVVGDRFGSGPEDYRESYRNMLRESPSLGRVFDEMRGFSLAENYDDVLDSFTRVAGHDLDNMTGASGDPVLLGMLLKELDTLKKMRSVFDQAGMALAKIDSNVPAVEGDGRPDAQELASRLFHFATSPVATLADAQRLLTGFGTEPPDLRVLAVNELLTLHAALPDTVFPDPNSRIQQKQLLLTLSDSAVAHEEDAYAG